MASLKSTLFSSSFLTNSLSSSPVCSWRWWGWRGIPRTDGKWTKIHLKSLIFLSLALQSISSSASMYYVCIVCAIIGKQNIQLMAIMLQSIFVINFFCTFETFFSMSVSSSPSSFFCRTLSSQHVHVNDPHNKSPRSVRGAHLQQQDILWKPQECNFPEAAVERPPWMMIMMITMMMM